MNRTRKWAKQRRAALGQQRTLGRSSPVDARPHEQRCGLRLQLTNFQPRKKNFAERACATLSTRLAEKIDAG